MAVLGMIIEEFKLIDFHCNWAYVPNECKSHIADMVHILDL